MEALVAVLLAWIHATAGYVAPERPPLVQLVQPRLIADIMCDSQPKCPVLAMYLHGNTIFLDDRLDVHGNDYHTSILLHELVHYVQQQTGRFREGNCDSWIKEEQEAFRIQTAWLRERTISFPQRHQIPRPEHLCAGGLHGGTPPPQP
jgi:hypothetical protein